VAGDSQETHGGRDEVERKRDKQKERDRERERERERERKREREAQRTMANSSLPAAEDVSHEISHHEPLIRIAVDS